MRNRRGEIATILTIGTLVVIGIAAIASSFNINKKQTTSSRASTCAKGIDVGGGFYSCQANCGLSTSGNCYATTHNSKDKDCNPCNGTGAPANTPIPTQGGPAPTQSGGNGPPAGRTCERTTSFTECKDDHAGSWEYLTVGTGKWCCSKGSGTNPSATPLPANDNWTCNGKGGEDFKVSSDTQCSNYCKGNGSEYVPGSQGYIGTQHYCCCTAPLPPDGDDSCCLLKCPADGVPTSVVWAPSLRAGTIPLTSCDGDRAYNTGWLYLCKDTYHCEGGAIKPGGVVPPPSNNPPETGCKPTDTFQECPDNLPRGVTGTNNSKWCCPKYIPPNETGCNGLTSHPYACTEYCAWAGRTGGNTSEYFITGSKPNEKFWADEKCKTIFDPKAKCGCTTNITITDNPLGGLKKFTCEKTCPSSMETDTPNTPYYSGNYQNAGSNSYYDMSLNKIADIQIHCGCKVKETQQGKFFSYSKCNKIFDCRINSDATTNPNCKNNESGSVDLCINGCPTAGTACYMNWGMTSKPYLYCCTRN